MTDLIEAKGLDPVKLLCEPGNLEELLRKIEKEATKDVPDVSTATSRKEIGSIAYKVARSKTILDDVGKDFVAERKEAIKEIDAQRKKARDFLDKLKDKIRKPLDEWEAEEKRKEEAAKRFAVSEKGIKERMVAGRRQSGPKRLTREEYELAEAKLKPQIPRK